jgi:DNA-binding protein HU-beta
MVTTLTKTALVRQLAVELNNKQSAAGLGPLVKAERKARMGRNPQTGEAIKSKAKTVVKPKK